MHHLPVLPVGTSMYAAVSSHRYGLKQYPAVPRSLMKTSASTSAFYLVLSMKNIFVSTTECFCSASSFSSDLEKESAAW